MIKHVVTATVIAASLAAPTQCGSASKGPDKYGKANAATQRVCDDISAAVSANELTDKAHEVQIKLDGAKAGVNQSVRNAIDAYYAKVGGSGDLLRACRNAGASQ